jgi:predicted nucleic acid-binding protein
LSILVDSNVIIDVIMRDKTWYEWSSGQLKKLAEITTLVINPIIYAELSVTFATIEDVEAAVSIVDFARENLPWEAACLAGKCHLQYRNSGGVKIAPLPDFFIGAHAYVTKRILLTRDKKRYSTYFPTLELISPEHS